MDFQQELEKAAQGECGQFFQNQAHFGSEIKHKFRSFDIRCDLRASRGTNLEMRLK